MRCDSHVHIVGPRDRYPQVEGRTYIAGVAKLDTLRRLGAARGISRFVIVQPSFYGSDNTALLEALDALGDLGRGVAVVDSATPSVTLADHARRGVRGLRVNLYSPIRGSAERRFDRVVGAMAEVAGPLGWHVEVIAALETLATNADVLAAAAVPIVIDHYALHGRFAPDSAAGERLLEVLRLPHVWIKLSGPYRISDDPMNTRPNRAWVAAITAVAAERCVWGSDWPHTPPHGQMGDANVELPYRAFSYDTMVDEFIAALPSRDLVEPIMSDNAARLYGF
jgi:predicted TIM-barrel fold metal-dependent hydrolase